MQARHLDDSIGGVFAYDVERLHSRRLGDLLRDILGNPYRPVTISAVWQTEATRALAQQIDAQRDWGLLPILADALQEAGCDNPIILDHCRRSSPPHTRGCWVIDGLLGRA